MYSVFDTIKELLRKLLSYWANYWVLNTFADILITEPFTELIHYH